MTEPGAVRLCANSRLGTLTAHPPLPAAGCLCSAPTSNAGHTRTETYKVTNHGGRQSELGIYTATNNRQSIRRYGVYDEKRPERGSERIQLSGFHKQEDDEVTDHSGYHYGIEDVTKQ